QTRLKIAHDEELSFAKAEARLKARIMAERMAEHSANLERQVERLAKAEAAVLNILEDARRLEGELKEERDRARAIISAIAEGLLVIDKDFNVTLANPVALSLLGVSDEHDILGHDVRRALSVFNGEQPVAPEKILIFGAMEEKGMVQIGLKDNIYIQNTLGRKFPVSVISAPLYSGGAFSAVVVFQDITEQKEFDEAKSSFVAIASHQLRTPLVSIRWFSEMLQSGDAGKLGDEQQDFVNRIYKGVIRLIGLINTLLVMAKTESGTGSAETVMVDVRALTDDILKELDPQLKQKGLVVALKAAAESVPNVVADPLMLRQVISNLIANSIRYTNEQGRIDIEIGASAEGDFVVYSVKDDGIGIPPADKYKIFQRFFRSANAKQKIGEGSGLGLSLVKALVDAWGGRVWFESPIAFRAGEPPKGSAFYFMIPIKATGKVPPPVPIPVAPANGQK
ncbi:MAG: PAS domain-containing protein, partial [Candidatus Niyogibacteria bacterium]|nr:PAS domain-containing protein [Candidatus Niyogibacteria bacterium]